MLLIHYILMSLVIKIMHKKNLKIRRTLIIIINEKYFNALEGWKVRNNFHLRHFIDKTKRKITFWGIVGFPKRFCCSLYISSFILAWDSSSKSSNGIDGSMHLRLIFGSPIKQESHHLCCNFCKHIWKQENITQIMIHINKVQTLHKKWLQKLLIVIHLHFQVKPKSRINAQTINTRKYNPTEKLLLKK